MIRKIKSMSSARLWRLRDASVAAAFVGAIAILLLTGCYVIGRLASERAYRAKWEEYNDCGWA